MENSKEGTKEELLLYIHQPKFKQPERKMQDSFLSEEITDTIDLEKIFPKEVQKKQSFTLPPLDSEKVIEVVQDIPEEKQEEQKEEIKKPATAADYFRRNTASRKNWNLRPATRFRDMSITEKLQYLSGFPSSQQPFPCEFITEKQQYKGTLSKVENNRIFIKNIHGDMDEIDVKELQTIKILL
ncbi:spore coat CotO family protein [Bacillus sp. IITD106]|nr:spore coat CotO family protein [Bacillus sp. IITD106]